MGRLPRGAAAALTLTEQYGAQANMPQLLRHFPGLTAQHARAGQNQHYGDQPSETIFGARWVILSTAATAELLNLAADLRMETTIWRSSY